MQWKNSLPQNKNAKKIYFRSNSSQLLINFLMNFQCIFWGPEVEINIFFNFFTRQNPSLREVHY